MSSESDLAAEKASIRRAALARRRMQLEPERTSAAILGRLAQRPEFQAARAILFYVAARSEVRTQLGILLALADEKNVAVPYCVGDELALFRLLADDLTPGAFGILEPRADLRARPEHAIDLAAIDLVVTPGIAFDPSGNRLGHGRGYYDRLLARVAPSTTCIGLAFDCQIWPRLPVGAYDIPVDVVLTESTAYEGDRTRRTERRG